MPDDAPPPLPADLAAFKPPEPPSDAELAKVNRPPPAPRARGGGRLVGEAEPELPEVDDFPL